MDRSDEQYLTSLPIYRLVCRVGKYHRGITPTLWLQAWKIAGPRKLMYLPEWQTRCSVFTVHVRWRFKFKFEICNKSFEILWFWIIWRERKHSVRWEGMMILVDKRRWRSLLSLTVALLEPGRESAWARLVWSSKSIPCVNNIRYLHYQAEQSFKTQRIPSFSTQYLSGCHNFGCHLST